MSDNLDHLQWLSWLDDQHKTMIDSTITLANINSGSFNADGVNKVRKKIEQLIEPLNASSQVIELKPLEFINNDGSNSLRPLGSALRVSKHNQAPLKVFLCAHMDTVFSTEHSFQNTRWLDKNTLNGPGVTDLKGGIIVMLKALEALERSPLAGKIGWEILFNPDEEIGSPSSAALLTEAATRSHVGMIYEPCMPDGTLAGDRKGSGNFTIVSSGKSAHAGREHHLGRNAIRHLCDFISELDNLNGKRSGVTINPGFIFGGGAVNVVPDHCIFRFNIRIEKTEDEHWCYQKIEQILNQLNKREGLFLKLHGNFSRKPKVLTPANLKLFQLLKDCGRQLNLPVNWLASGGCCDGNNLATAGLPNIDTLGVQGGSIHSSDEYLLVDSLIPRAKLSALLLMKLAEGKDYIKLFKK